jgi:GDP-4-dehydro-6-deoxy-D-mannose reductase
LRALISGATGFVGPHLCEHLLAQGDEVTAFSLGSASQLGGAVTFIPADIRDATAVHAAFERVQPEVVYHLTAISSIAAARNNPRLAFEVNVTGTYNLFEAAMGLRKPPRILNVSTSQVYSDAVDLITEDSPVCPANPYAASKAMAEQMPKLFSGADWVTVRPFNHSGPGQTREFVLPSLAAQVAEIEFGLRPPVLQVGDTDVERDFMDVRDVVVAYRHLIERGRRGHVYNVASGTAWSIASVIEVLRSLARAPFDVRSDPSLRRPEQRRFIRADAAKLRTDTGWQPTIPLRIMLGDLLTYWRALQNNPAVSPETVPS